MIEKIAFTMYPVQDAQRARAFYGEVLGLKAGSQSPEGTWTEYDLPGGGCLALFRTDDIKASASAGGTVALEVDDLDAERERLKAAGVTFVHDLIPSPVCRMAILLDSEGNSLMLHQLHKKSGQAG